MMRTIHTIGNLGTGTMGCGTALQFAMAGYDVHLIGRSQDSLDVAMARIHDDAEELFANGLMRDGDTVDTVVERITAYGDTAAGVADVAFIIESIVEDLEVKREVWHDVEQHAPNDTIFATNTSGLSPSAIQSALERPERFVVAHFWNPVHLMPLVEVVPGESTAPEVVETTYELMQAIGKKAVKLNRESLGFVGNRMQLALLREALAIIREGIADADAVDTVVKYSLGRRWNVLGPIASIDLGGLDTFRNVSEYLYADLDAGQGPDPLLAEKVAAGNLGAKTGQGFYPWSGEKGRQTIAYRDQALMQALKADQAES